MILIRSKKKIKWLHITFTIDLYCALRMLISADVVPHQSSSLRLFVFYFIATPLTFYTGVIWFFIKIMWLFLATEIKWYKISDLSLNLLQVSEYEEVSWFKQDNRIRIKHNKQGETKRKKIKYTKVLMVASTCFFRSIFYYVNVINVSANKPQKIRTQNIIGQNIIRISKETRETISPDFKTFYVILEQMNFSLNILLYRQEMLENSIQNWVFYLKRPGYDQSPLWSEM